MSEKKVEKYSIENCIIYNGKVYAPIDSIIGFCNKYPKVPINDLSRLLYGCITDKEQIKKLPEKGNNEKSFFGSGWGKLLGENDEQ